MASQAAVAEGACTGEYTAGRGSQAVAQAAVGPL
jgi:hypothetical protein